MLDYDEATRRLDKADRKLWKDKIRVMCAQTRNGKEAITVEVRYTEQCGYDGISYKWRVFETYDGGPKYFDKVEDAIEIGKAEWERRNGKIGDQIVKRWKLWP